MAVLVETIKVTRERKDGEILIYWNEWNVCKAENRNYRDNVANVFLPKLCDIKKQMATLKDLDVSAEWIKASLCDGDDEKTVDLDKALDASKLDPSLHKKRLQIRSSIYNIVLALHRVDSMKKRFSEIFSAVIDGEHQV